MRREWTTVQFLSRLLRLFDRHSHWTKGEFFADKKVNGRKVRCYCLRGAVNHLGGAPNPGLSFPQLNRREAYWGALEHLGEAIGGDMVSFNDDHKTKFSDIKRVIRKALKKAKEEAAA